MTKSREFSPIDRMHDICPGYDVWFSYSEILSYVEKLYGCTKNQRGAILAGFSREFNKRVAADVKATIAEYAAAEESAAEPKADRYITNSPTYDWHPNEVHEVIDTEDGSVVALFRVLANAQTRAAQLNSPSLPIPTAAEYDADPELWWGKGAGIPTGHERRTDGMIPVGEPQTALGGDLISQLCESDGERLPGSAIRDALDNEYRLATEAEREQHAAEMELGEPIHPDIEVWIRKDAAAECSSCAGTGFLASDHGDVDYCDREDCSYWATRDKMAHEEARLEANSEDAMPNGQIDPEERCRYCGAVAPGSVCDNCDSAFTEASESEPKHLRLADDWPVCSLCPNYLIGSERLGSVCNDCLSDRVGRWATRVAAEFSPSPSVQNAIQDTFDELEAGEDESMSGEERVARGAADQGRDGEWIEATIKHLLECGIFTPESALKAQRMSEQR